MLEKMSEMIAEQLNCDAETITADTSFKDDLGADSLDLFELVMALEDEYNIEIPAEELTELNTVRFLTYSQNDRLRYTLVTGGFFSMDILNGLGI